jgi:hypothetical protein
VTRNVAKTLTAQKHSAMKGNILATLWPALEVDHGQSIFETAFYIHIRNKNLKANILTQG